MRVKEAIRRIMQFDIIASKVEDSDFNLLKTYPEFVFLRKLLKNELSEFVDKNREHVLSILDVGTGPGSILLTTRDVTGPQCHLVGMDISLKMLKVARRKIGKAASLVQAPAENMPFRDEVFDLVFSRNALHHLCNIDMGLAEIKRVLRHNGAFICIESVGPNNDALTYWIPILRYKDRTRTTYFTEISLIKLIESSGFNVELKEVLTHKISLKEWLDRSSLTTEARKNVLNMILELPNDAKKAYGIEIKEIKEKSIIFTRYVCILLARKVL